MFTPDFKPLYTAALFIGGGGAGWHSALALSKRGYSNIIIDKDPPGEGASIRNQGWLHSGAFYLASDTPDPIMAKGCLQGYRNMLSDYPEVVQQEVNANFLYTDKELAEELIINCREKLGIATRLVQIRQVIEHESLLRGSQLRYAVPVPDHSFNNSQLLQAVADHAFRLGTRFCAVDSLECVTAEWDGTNWHVFPDQKQEIICRLIVLSCGGYIPEMLAKLSPGQPSGILRTKNPVLVLKANTPIARSMLLTMRQDNDVHLVPFRGSGVSGVTVCCAGMQENILDSKDTSLHPEWKDTFSSLLADYYPGIIDLARNNDIFAYPYPCQKVEQEKDRCENRANRQPFCKVYTPQQGAAGNIAIIYPGKLTTASSLGEMCADGVEPLLGDFPRTAITVGIQTPRIAKQPYHRNAQYVLTVQNGNLLFKEITQ